MPDYLNMQNDLLSRLTQQQQEMLYTQLQIAKELSRRSGASLPAALHSKYESLGNSMEQLSENESENINVAIADGKSATNWSAAFAPSEFLKGASDVIITGGKMITGPAGEALDKAYDITTGLVDVSNSITAGNDSAAHGNEAAANKDYSSASAGIVGAVSKIGEVSGVADPGHVFKQLSFLGNSMALVNAQNENDYHASAKELTSLMGKFVGLADKATGSAVEDANTIVQGVFKMQSGVEKIYEGAEFWQQQHKQIEVQGNNAIEASNKAFENMNANRYEVFKYRQMLQMGNDPQTDNLLNALAQRNPQLLQNEMKHKISSQQDLIIDKVFHYAATSPFKMPEEELNTLKPGSNISESKLSFNNAGALNKENFSADFQQTGKPDRVQPLADTNLVNLANNAGAIQQFLAVTNTNSVQQGAGVVKNEPGIASNNLVQGNTGRNTMLSDPFQGQTVNSAKQKTPPHQPAQGIDPNLAKADDPQVTEGRYLTDQENNPEDKSNSSLSEFSKSLKEKIMEDLYPDSGRHNRSSEPELPSLYYENLSTGNTLADDAENGEAPYSDLQNEDNKEYNNYSPEKSQQPKDVVDEMYDDFKNYVNQITSQSTITPVTNGNNLHGPSIDQVIASHNSYNQNAGESQKNLEEMQRQIERLQNISSSNFNLSGSSSNAGNSGYNPDGDDFTPTNELADGGY
jgi:hypothetical protein